jgi:hypothetical protein
MGGTTQGRRPRIAPIVKGQHPDSQRPEAEAFRGERAGTTVAEATAGNIRRPALGALETAFRQIGRRLANGPRISCGDSSIEHNPMFLRPEAPSAACAC